MVLVFITIVCTVCGNLLLKIGAGYPGFGQSWPLSVLNIRVLAGATSFGLGFLFYAMLLQRMPLNIAQSFFSVQFVFVILASALILGENVGWLRWSGIAMVACGLFIIGWSIPPQSS